MAAWLSEAVHREMRAAARDVCKSGGACRALAWASSFTNMEASSLHRPPVSIPSTTSQHPAELVSPGEIVVEILKRDRAHKWLGCMISAHTQPRT